METENNLLTLSEKDSILFVDILENPPEPNKRLIEAAKKLNENKMGFLER